MESGGTLFVWSITDETLLLAGLFFTVNLRDRQCDWLVRNIDLLRLAIRETRRTGGYVE